MRKPFKTAVGTLMWVYVTGDGRDNSEAKDGSKMQKVATIHLQKDTKECKQMIEALHTAWEEYAQEAHLKANIQPKTLGYKVVKDAEGVETDIIAFQFKTNTFFPDGRRNEVKIYNAAGAPVELGDTLIGNGSIGVIHGEVAGYCFAKQYGLSLYLKGVQIAKLEKTATFIEPDDLTDVGDFSAVDGSVEGINL